MPDFDSIGEDVSHCQPKVHLQWASGSQPVRKLSVVSLLPQKLKDFVEESVRLCRPSNVYVCDGSEAENSMLIELLLENRTIVPLPKYKNW
jgi:phosphoenolpyruvate carboxykinase (GTP)